MGSQLPGIAGGGWKTSAELSHPPSSIPWLEKLRGREVEEFRSILKERDPELRSALMLAFGGRLEERGKPALAAEVYLATGGRAQARLDALMGRGIFGGRAELLLGNFVTSATDYRMILPFVAGSTVFRLTRAWTLGRLSSTTSAWWSQGIGRNGIATLAGFFVEAPTFAALSSGLQGRGLPASEDLGRSFLGLGALKLFGYAGGRGAEKVPPLSSLPALGRWGKSLIPQFSMLGGLAAAHRLEKYFGFSPYGPDPSWADHAATLLSLNVGSNISSRILGRGFAKFQAELELRNSNSPAEGRSDGLAALWLAQSAGPVALGRNPSASSFDPAKAGVLMMTGLVPLGQARRPERDFYQGKRLVQDLVQKVLSEKAGQPDIALQGLIKLLKRKGHKMYFQPNPEDPYDRFDMDLVSLSGLAAQGLDEIVHKAPEKISKAMLRWLLQEGLRLPIPDDVRAVAHLLGTLATHASGRITPQWMDALKKTAWEYPDEWVAVDCAISLSRILEEAAPHLVTAVRDIIRALASHPSRVVQDNFWGVWTGLLHGAPERMTRDDLLLFLGWMGRGSPDPNAADIPEILLRWIEFGPKEDRDWALGQILERVPEGQVPQKVRENLGGLLLLFPSLSEAEQIRILDAFFKKIQESRGKESLLSLLLAIGRAVDHIPQYFTSGHLSILLELLDRHTDGEVRLHAVWVFDRLFPHLPLETSWGVMDYLNGYLERQTDPEKLVIGLAVLESAVKRDPKQVPLALLPWLREKGIRHPNGEVAHDAGRVMDILISRDAGLWRQESESLLNDALKAESPVLTQIAARLLGWQSPGELQGMLLSQAERLQELLSASSEPEILHGAAHLLGISASQGKEEKFLQGIWELLGLKRMAVGDKGNGISTIPPFMLGYLREPMPFEAALKISQVPFRVIEKSPDTYLEFLKEQGVQGKLQTLGRSLVYPTQDPGELFVLKAVREGQSAEDLAREGQWLLALEKAGLGLKSRLPRPLTDETGSLLLFNFQGGKTVLPMRVPADYYRYLNEAEMEAGAFFRGLEAALHDVFQLARRGVFHTVPIRLFHNTEANHVRRYNGDRGHYVLAPDVVFYHSERSGMGRLDHWQGGLQYGNYGASGLRDLEELAAWSEVAEQPVRWAPEFLQMRNRKNYPALAQALMLGIHLFAATLFVGQRMSEEAKGRGEAGPLWQDEVRLKYYSERLLGLFATAYGVRQQISQAEAMAILRPRAEWPRLARQLAFFMTPAYVPFLEAGADPQAFPLQEIYGEKVQVRGAKGETFGPYREGTFAPGRGWIGPDGDIDKLSLGAVNGQFPIREFEKVFWGMFLPPPSSLGAEKGVPQSGGVGLMRERLSAVSGRLKGDLAAEEREVFGKELEILEEWLRRDRVGRFRLFEELRKLYLRKSRILGPGRLGFLTELQKEMAREVKAGDLYREFLEKAGDQVAYFRFPAEVNRPSVLRLNPSWRGFPIIGSDPFSQGRVLYPQYFRLEDLVLYQDKVSDTKLEKFRRAIRNGETFGAVKVARDRHGGYFLYDGYHRSLAAYLEGATHILGEIPKDKVRLFIPRVKFEEIKIVPDAELQAIIRANTGAEPVIPGWNSADSEEE